MTQIAHSEDPGSSRWVGITRIVAAIGIVAVVGTAMFSDYLSSWLPKVGGFPAGAILRDGVAISFVILAGAVLIRGRADWRRPSLASVRSPWVAVLAIVPFAAFAGWVVILILPSPAMVPAVLAARNLLLYATVGFAAYVLVSRRTLSVDLLLGTITAFGFLAAGLGLLDAATHGGIVTTLGYSRDYSGVEGSANVLISGTSAAFQGYLRASGGISNSLVFGYLMAVIAVFATWMLDRSVVRSGWRDWATVVYLALGILASMACIESFTRGAMIALVSGLVLLLVLRRRRPILVGALATLGISFFLTWAGTGVVSALSPGQAAAPGQVTAPGSATAPDPTAGQGILDVFGTRMTSSDPSSQESSSLRLDQVRRGLESLAARPMGNGLGTEGSAVDRAGKEKMAADNFVLIVALQTGIIGVVLYGLIFAAMLFWTARRRTPGRELVLAMIAIFGIASVLSASPDAPVFSTMVWILILAVSAVAVLDGRGARSTPS